MNFSAGLLVILPFGMSLAFRKAEKNTRLAARVFSGFPKISRHPTCKDHAILHGNPLSNPLVNRLFYSARRCEGIWYKGNPGIQSWESGNRQCIGFIYTLADTIEITCTYLITCRKYEIVFLRDWAEPTLFWKGWRGQPAKWRWK